MYVFIWVFYLVECLVIIWVFDGVFKISWCKEVVQGGRVKVVFCMSIGYKVVSVQAWDSFFRVVERGVCEERFGIIVCQLVVVKYIGVGKDDWAIDVCNFRLAIGFIGFGVGCLGRDVSNYGIIYFIVMGRLEVDIIWFVIWFKFSIGLYYSYVGDQCF